MGEGHLSQEPTRVEGKCFFPPLQGGLESVQSFPSALIFTTLFLPLALPWHIALSEKTIRSFTTYLEMSHPIIKWYYIVNLVLIL